jgi:hypothetical protein
MNILKKIRLWMKGTRRSPIKKTRNRQRSVPPKAAQEAVELSPVQPEVQSPSVALSERDDISRRMKEMVNRSVELRNSASKGRRTYEPRGYQVRDAIAPKGREGAKYSRR